MRRAEARTMPPPAEQRSDVRLWTAILMSPLAMGINTVVGFTVAHWTCDTNQKKFSYLVSAVDLAISICAYLLASTLHAHYNEADELSPENGRRLFMSRIGMLLAGISILLVIGQTLVVMTLHSCD